MFFSVFTFVSIFPIIRLTFQDYYYFCWNMDNQYCPLFNLQMFVFSFSCYINLKSSHLILFLNLCSNFFLHSAHLNQTVRNYIWFRVSIVPILDIPHLQWYKLLSLIVILLIYLILRTKQMKLHVISVFCKETKGLVNEICSNSGIITHQRCVDAQCSSTWNLSSQLH